jgi:hypothetical protein
MTECPQCLECQDDSVQNCPFDGVQLSCPLTVPTIAPLPAPTTAPVPVTDEPSCTSVRFAGTCLPLTPSVTDHVPSTSAVASGLGKLSSYPPRLRYSCRSSRTH